MTNSEAGSSYSPNLDLNKNVKELTEHFFHYRNVLAYRVKDFSDSSAAVERVVELEGGDDHLNNQVNRDAKIFCVTRIQLVRHVVNDQLKIDSNHFKYSKHLLTGPSVTGNMQLPDF